MIIGSSVPLKSVVMTQMVHSRISLRSWKRFCSSCRLDHKLITGLVHHPLVNYIHLLLNIFLFNSRGNYQSALWPSQTSLLWGCSQLNYFLQCILIWFCQRRSSERKGHHQASFVEIRSTLAFA